MSGRTFGIRFRPAAAAMLAALCLFPFLYLILLSFVREWTFPNVWPDMLSLESWRRVLWGSSALGQSFLLSLAVSAVVAAASTAAGYVTGKYIAYHRHHTRLLLLAYLPFVMSPVILGTCLMYLYIKADLTGGVFGVMLAQTTFAYGFSIVFFSAFWTAEVKALEDLVYTLGGTTGQAYRRVLIPISLGALLICFFQTFLISWFQYGLTVLIGAGKVQTLPVKVYEYIGEANVPYAALASCLLVLPPAVLLWANKRYVFRQV
jgi:putative spermidine/putrescine transport system permease protein